MAKQRYDVVNTIDLLDFEEYISLGHLNLDDKDFLMQKQELDDNPLAGFHDDPIGAFIRTIRDPRYLHFTCEHLMGINLLPQQHVVLAELFKYISVLMVCSRGFGKSWSLALYIILKMIINQGIQVVVVGAAFRQAKLIAIYVEKFWDNAPLLRSMCGNSDKNGFRKGNDKWTFRIGESVANFLPLGDGGTIRGERANIIIVDEFSMVPIDVYETVVKGFTAVSRNPADNVVSLGRIRQLKRLGYWDDAQQALYEAASNSNQQIISGTAYYSFNSFYDYYKKQCRIIESQGDLDSLNDIFTDGPPKGFNWHDYTVIRVPEELISEGFLDEKSLGDTQVKVTPTVYMMEYGAVFPEDSNGFFPRTLVESCVLKEQQTIGENVVRPFNAMLSGTPGTRHVIGVDPASESDNCSIVVIEMDGPIRRVVYCWTTTRSLLAEKMSRKIVKDQDYYGYIARKIRDIMKHFPNVEVIALDAQGGGVGVIEALGDADKMEPGELPIYVVNPDHPFTDGKDRETDHKIGEHIVEWVQFARAEYIADANHGLKKDMIDKVLLFPYFDAVKLARVSEDKATPDEFRMYDSLEDCMLEIEALKDELATIIVSQTPETKRERWTTPEIKLADNRKGRLRKDRYSALLIANMAARRLQRAPAPMVYHSAGGVKGQIGKSSNQNMYIGPDWFVKATSQTVYGAAVTK